LPICSYNAGLGNAGDLTGNPTVTTAMSGAVGNKLPNVANELMVLTSLGNYVFRSSHAQWGWLTVANGSINSSSMTTYGVEGSSNGGPFVTVNSIALAGNKGAVMLGGLQDDKNYSPFIGIGAQKTGTFSQDANCTATSSSLRGIFGGVLGGAWNVSAELLIR
jgi:hypothetical protein